MTALQAFDRPIAFHRGFVAITGSVTGALFLSQAVYWQNRPGRISEDGWWFKTAEDFERETGLTRRELEGARKACDGIVLHKLKGVPATSWYKVDEAALQTSMAKSAKLDWPKPPNRDGGNRQTICTETSSETSSESTHTERVRFSGVDPNGNGAAEPNSVPRLQALVYEMFNRPKQENPSYSEISMLCEITRRPGWIGEVQEIKHFKLRLPAKERRYFPQSVERLVCNWQPTLDRARMYEPNPQDRSHGERHIDAQLKRLLREVGDE